MGAPQSQRMCVFSLSLALYSCDITVKIYIKVALYVVFRVLSLDNIPICFLKHSPMFQVFSL